MNELSVFIDESGDFGDYRLHSSYYIISMVFHDQSDDIQPQIKKLEENLSYIGYPHHCTHIGPIIRNEYEYRRDTLENRQKILKQKTLVLSKTQDLCTGSVLVINRCFPPQYWFSVAD